MHCDSANESDEPFSSTSIHLLYIIEAFRLENERQSAPAHTQHYDMHIGERASCSVPMCQLGNKGEQIKQFAVNTVCFCMCALCLIS